MNHAIRAPAQMMDVTEAAEFLGLSPERVRQLIRTGQLRATKINGWRITLAQLEEFIRSRTSR